MSLNMASQDETEHKKEGSTSSFLSVDGPGNTSITSTKFGELSPETNSERDYRRLKKEEEACSVCVKREKLRPATHFCEDCGQCGKYLCHDCLKNHYDFTNGHKVKSLSVKRER